MSHQIAGGMLGALVFMWTAAASAGIPQIKAYKEAYPDAKPKCIDCHVSDKPKKDDGAHDLNEYGKKVVAIEAEPTAETYTKAGPIDGSENAK